MSSKKIIRLKTPSRTLNDPKSPQYEVSGHMDEETVMKSLQT